jgi:hypothetical protein
MEERLYLEAGVRVRFSLLLPFENITLRKDNRLSSISKYTASDGSPLKRRKKKVL